MISCRFCMNVFIVATAVAVSMVKDANAGKSDCACAVDIYDKIDRLEREVDLKKHEIVEWNMLLRTVTDLKEWKENIDNIFKTSQKENNSADLRNDSEMTPKMLEENGKVSKNVSNLVAKVKKLENRIVKIEKELKSERRFRRQLEQEVKETRSTLVSVEDQLQSVSIPIDAVLSHIQMAIFSSIEDMNRTIYEDYLQKLDNKVDAVVYKNGIKILGQRIELVKDQIEEEFNSSIFSKLTENMKNLEESLRIINNSIGNELLPRMIILESETIRKDAAGIPVEEIITPLNKTEKIKGRPTNVWTEIQDFETTEIHIHTCDDPVTNDTHLLIDIEIEANGTQKLVFGCRPIGEYVVNNPPIPVRCEGGSWSGPLPTCHRLLDSNEIKLFSSKLKTENPCTANSRELFPDSTNCSRFIHCTRGIANLVSCPKGLHFKQNLKVCDYPLSAGCEEDPSELIQQLRNLIPTILIEPNISHNRSGFLATGPGGQLIVYPLQSFTLHCLYPINIWGHPRWEVAYSNPEADTRNLVSQYGKNKVSLKIIVAKEEDTGLYTCKTRFGKAHGIIVSVKERCKPLNTASSPDLILVKEFDNKTVYFKCAGGLKLVGDTHTKCLDDGTWSHSSLPKCV